MFKNSFSLQMSVLIKECADRLIVKFDEIAKSEGKIDAKEY
jgi:hypothetical protein